MKETETSIRIVRPDEGESVWAMSERLTFKLGADDTGGFFGLAEIVAQPGGGPPPHIHRHEDELFYVLEGEFDFVLGDRVFRRSEGFAAYLPRNILHTYNYVGQHSGRLLGGAMPCGFEEFVRQWAHPVKDFTERPPVPTEKDLEKLMAAAFSYGIELHPEAHPSPEASLPAREEAYWVGGELTTIKLTSNRTEGHFSLVETSIFPGPGWPLHSHQTTDEVVYVLDGAIELNLYLGMQRLSAGTLAFVPRGTMHSLRTAGDSTGRLLLLHFPGGWESFYQESGTAATDSELKPSFGQGEIERMLSLSQKYATDFRRP